MNDRISDIRATLAQNKKYNPITEQFYIRDVEHLLAEIDRLTEAQRWRDAETEPPKKGSYVIAISTHGSPDQCLYDGTGWYCHGYPVTVTHWMPLPSPPTETKGE
jgi:hypothetical protein